jgi:hypothetical protein
MRKMIAVLALSSFIVLGLVTSNALAAGVNYLGKTTWTFTITDSTKQSDIGMSGTVTGAISKVGDEFYLFQGYIILPDDGPVVMSGSGFMTGNTLEFTVSVSQYHTSNTWRDSSTGHLSLDRTTLNGTFYDIGHDFKSDPADRRLDDRYSTATLTRTGSAIPLNGSLAGVSLLLDE